MFILSHHSFNNKVNEAVKSLSPLFRLFPFFKQTPFVLFRFFVTEISAALYQIIQKLTKYNQILLNIILNLLPLFYAEINKFSFLCFFKNLLKIHSCFMQNLHIVLHVNKSCQFLTAFALHTDKTDISIIAVGILAAAIPKQKPENIF